MSRAPVVCASLLAIGGIALAIGAAAAAACDPTDVTWGSHTYTISQRDEGESQLVELWREGDRATLSVSLDLLCDRSHVWRLDADDDGTVDVVVDDCGHYRGVTMREGALTELYFGDTPPGLASAWGSEVQSGGTGLLGLGFVLVLIGAIGCARSITTASDSP